MSYYASDPANFDELAERLTEAFSAAAHATNWYALVDMAFDEGTKPWPLATPHVSLYDGSHLEQLRSVSPVLWEFPTHPPEAAVTLLRRLTRHAAGRPMLSFVGSKFSAAALSAALQPVLELETADGQSFLLRIADTRVLPALPLALTATHWSLLCAPIDAWHVVDRFGKLTTLPMLSRTEDTFTPTSRIRLDDDELTALLQAGEPDALIRALEEGFAELMPQKSRAALYTEVTQVCALAQAHGIEGAPDRLALVLVNRMAGGQLCHDARLLQWLAQAQWKSGGFSEALGEFVESLT